MWSTYLQRKESHALQALLPEDQEDGFDDVRVIRQ